MRTEQKTQQEDSMTAPGPQGREPPDARQQEDSMTARTRRGNNLSGPEREGSNPPLAGSGPSLMYFSAFKQGIALHFKGL